MDGKTRRIRFYFGTPGWGWKLYGVAFGEIWFIGLSINAELAKEQQG